MILTVVLSIVAFCVLVAEFWTGFAVGGFGDGEMITNREESPRQYWFTMALHTSGFLAVNVLAAFVR
jgi:hypothetical protein